MKLINDFIISEMIKQYNHSKKRIFFLDYDGTLVSIKPIPSLAIPSSELLMLLLCLAKDNRNHIFIISGRDAEFLDTWLGHLDITLVAEHGALIKYPNKRWTDDLHGSVEWKNDIRSFLNKYVKAYSGSFIEEKTFSLAWHYRNVEESLGIMASQILIKELKQIISKTSLGILEGSKVVEIKFNFISKGIVVTNILKEINPDFVVCIGDDATDENMFMVLQNDAFTIKVGMGLTVANYIFPLQTHVLSFLKTLCQNTKLFPVSCQ